MLMGNDKHGCSHGVDLSKEVDYLIGQLGVDVARRLVRNNNGRVVYKSTRKTDALLLTARKLGWLVVHFVLQPDQIENIRHALIDGRIVLSNRAHRKRNVVKDVHFVDEAEVLKNYPHMAAEIRHVAFFKL